MAWGESKTWIDGALNESLYQQMLDDAAEAPARNARRKKVVTPDEMPWEMSRQGLLKHLINEAMNTRMETVDAYMQIIPPGSRSGKHRHLAEECLYVLEGNGYHRRLPLEAPGRDQALRLGSRRRRLCPAEHHPSAFQCRPGPAGAADFVDQSNLQAMWPERP
jgi:hypothetical protein